MRADVLLFAASVFWLVFAIISGLLNGWLMV